MKYPLIGGGLAVVVVLLSGCAPHYNIRTNNGAVLTAKGKPRYDKAEGVFVYKDANGQMRRVPAGSVREIAPTSDASDSSKFKAPGAN
jgi:hypothetical protein